MAAPDRILPNGYFAAIAAVSSFQYADNLAPTRHSLIFGSGIGQSAWNERVRGQLVRTTGRHAPWPSDEMTASARPRAEAVSFCEVVLPSPG